VNVPLNIIIADDHPIFRRGLVDVIATDPGLRVVGQASQGEETLRLVEELKPDVVVLDVKMPRLTGLQVARVLAERKSSTKVVLLTMYEAEELLTEALDLGIRAYVLKDHAVEDLLAAIRAVMEHRSFLSASLSELVLRRRDDRQTLRREKPGLTQLTPAEQRILALIAEDKTTKEIADLLACAVRTVETHRQNISTKLDLKGTHSLLKFAYDNKTRLCFSSGQRPELGAADRA
jgi:DNA-binding NarL/FixJ family response regulator